MPRNLSSENKSPNTSEHSEESLQASSKNQTIDQNSTQEEDFVDVDHHDVDMHDSEAGRPNSLDDLDLQRFGNNIESVDDDDLDDGDDQEGNMAHHPLLSMLSGRLAPRRRGSVHKWDKLHPENQVLSVANVVECTKLEEEAFPEVERCSREKFQYRLNACPELSLGLFSQPTKAESEHLSSKPGRKLIAHIVATRTASPSVTEASMGVPNGSHSSSLSSSDERNDEPLGHQHIGGTVCLHSLAVAKEHQNMGLGSILLKSYIQRIKDSKSADRIALLAHDHLVRFYQGFGFDNMGPSSVTSCGGGWNNMILELDHGEEEE